MSLTNNKHINNWIDSVVKKTKPDSVVWIDGSEVQLEQLRKEAVDQGILSKLNEELLPNCYLHRTNPNDVARVENRTFICCEKEEDAGPTNYWMEPAEMYKLMDSIIADSMIGRTMYVIPYSMGPVGSSFAKYGIELTDSSYVVLNMAIMTRVGKNVLDAIGDNDGFIKGVHTQGTLDPEKKYIVHFPQDNAIFSTNSNYGGNVLQGKKCFALRMASNLARDEGWMAEHMLILGIENPQGEVRYVCGAFPSACGKTNLAMLIPPEGYKKDGWKTWCVGDDIAWIRPGEDGRLYAVNPENGFFGVAPGTNMKSNPNAVLSAKEGTIFTNVALDTSNNSVWWEGLNKTPPAHAIDWLGRDWTPESPDKAAHANSRFTAPATNCPVISPEFENPKGVPISAIIFGGRRAKTAPLVYQSRNWDHGVFVGSTMASETTAAQAGAVGIVRRDPMAILPFCGYNMARYWQHWVDMKDKADNLPKIFNVNWFRLDDEGNFIWPGFGDNLRVLEWIIKRCFDEVDAKECEIGYIPYTKDINIEGTDIDTDTLQQMLEIDRDLWKKEAEEIREYYKKFGDKVPKELMENLEILESKLK